MSDHKVRSRIEFSQDLYASDAKYHQVCSSNFRTGKQIPVHYRSAFDIKPERKGRPTDSLPEEAFLKVAAYLQEADEEQVD